jgi:hypothetical protein
MILSIMSSIKLTARVLVVLYAFVICTNMVLAQQRPLLTEDVDIITPGSLRIETGVDHFEDAEFPVSGLRGDLTRVGVIGINIGLSPNVEVQIDGVIQNFLSINSISQSSPTTLSIAPGEDSTNDVGDFTLSTKIKFRNDTTRGPSIGLRVGVQLPNSNREKGIGTNSFGAYGTVLIGKKFGEEDRLNLFSNLGIAILDAPMSTNSQNDVFLYGMAGIFRINKTFNLVGEVNGRANTRSVRAPLGTESQSEARLGMQIKTSKVRFDFAGIAGLSRFSPRAGFTLGLTFDTPTLFKPIW